MILALAPALEADDITMISLYPATLMDITMVNGIGIPARTTVAEGRDHVMGLITAPSLQPGAFYVKGRVAEPNDPQANDPAARARLVELSAIDRLGFSTSQVITHIGQAGSALHRI